MIGRGQACNDSNARLLGIAMLCFQLMQSCNPSEQFGAIRRTCFMTVCSEKWAIKRSGRARVGAVTSSVTLKNPTLFDPTSSDTEEAIKSLAKQTSFGSRSPEDRLESGIEFPIRLPAGYSAGNARRSTSIVGICSASSAEKMMLG
jgi:hypothetical protein